MRPANAVEISGTERGTDDGKSNDHDATTAPDTEYVAATAIASSNDP